MSRRGGFAGMDADRRREIASKGGKARAAKGVGHAYTSAEAKVAGSKGGHAVLAKRGPAHMAEIGSKGGIATRGLIGRRFRRNTPES